LGAGAGSLYLGRGHFHRVAAGDIIDRHGLVLHSVSAGSASQCADTISGYIQGLLDGIEFKQTAYALDRDSRKVALARFLKSAAGGDPEEVEEERRLAA
jgi:hypothetical protein